MVAEQQGTLVAAIAFLLRRGSAVARLYTLAVHPDARGQGLAQRMLTAAIAQLPRRCTTLSLEVRRANPARHLYERWGLTVVADLPGYYADGGAGLRMRAPLTRVISAVT